MTAPDLRRIILESKLRKAARRLLEHVGCAELTVSKGAVTVWCSRGAAPIKNEKCPNP